MEFLLSLLVGIIFVGLVGLIVFRAIRSKQLPENNYTPFDENMDESTDSDHRNF
jgi:hypothetical protein